MVIMTSVATIPGFPYVVKDRCSASPSSYTGLPMQSPGGGQFFYRGQAPLAHPLAPALPARCFDFLGRIAMHSIRCGLLLHI